MKNYIWLLLALPLLSLSCNNSGKDSVDKADSTNEAKNDTSKTHNDTTANKPVLGVDESTSSFLVKVADVGKTEIELGHIAEQKASSKKVKEFGAMMVKDHTKGDEELKGLAMKKNVTLPSNVSDEHKKKIDDLSSKSGKEFDKAYMDMMVDGHQSTVNDFEKQADNKDPDVKDFVNRMLSTLNMHLSAAKEIKKAINK